MGVLSISNTAPFVPPKELEKAQEPKEDRIFSKDIEPNANSNITQNMFEIVHAVWQMGRLIEDEYLKRQGAKSE